MAFERICRGLYQPNDKKFYLLSGSYVTLGTFGDKKWNLNPQEFQKVIDGMHSFEVAVHGHLDKVSAKS